MKIDFKPTPKNPVMLAGFFVLLTVILNGCQTAKTPEQVTLAFWQAMIHHDLSTAQTFVRQSDRSLLTPLNDDNATVTTGKIIIEKPRARVETFIKHGESRQRFSTYLVLEDNHWKIDYARTHKSFSGDVFENLLENLDKLGEQFNQQLEQQVLPQFQKEIQSLGDQLKQQLEQFNQNLEKYLQKPAPSKPLPPDQRQI